MVCLGWITSLKNDQCVWKAQHYTCCCACWSATVSTSCKEQDRTTDLTQRLIASEEAYYTVHVQDVIGALPLAQQAALVSE